MADDPDDFEVEYDPEPDDPRWLARSRSHADYIDALEQQRVDRLRWRDR